MIIFLSFILAFGFIQRDKTKTSLTKDQDNTSLIF